MKGLDMRVHTNGRLNKTQLAPTLSVAPVTRAIRAALAISATLLALGGSGAAIAQDTCTFTTPTTVSCDGAFTNTLPGTYFAPIDDLTLIAGDTAPTSVTPGIGLMGIDADWGGNVSVTTFADITTQGADGIFANSTAAATVNNQGSITTNGTSSGAKAMDVNAYGDVNIVNNGPINAYSNGVYDVTAVNAYSTNGNVSVDNQAAGTITATAQDGNAIAVNAYATVGAITVANEGSIAASSGSGYGIAVGVLAQAADGDVSVTNSGSITATSTNYQAVGILATSNEGYTTVSNSGYVTAAGGLEDTIGIAASGYLGAAVQNTGHVTATSTYGEAVGIQAEAYSGSASVNNSGTITSTSSSQYQTAIGALASSINGSATITNNGYVRADNAPGLAIGLESYSERGSSSITNSGYVLATSATGSATGVLASSVYGNVSVSNNPGGNIRAVATTGGSAAYGAPSYGIGISAESTHGDISIINAGSAYGGSLHGPGTGISAQAGGNVYVNNAAYASARGLDGAYGNATGIDVRSTGGSVAVVNAGGVYGSGSNRLGTYHDLNNVTGIEAVGVKGVTVANTGNGVISALGAWYATGIYTGSYGGTTITNSESGRIVVQGLVAKGIYAIETAQSTAGYGIGNVTVNNAGRISVTQTGYFSGLNLPRLIEYGTGISVLSSFGGDISITNSGSILVDTQQGGYGVRGYAFDSQVSENNSGSITLSGSGISNRLLGEYAKTAYSGGDVNIVNSGDITITTAPVVAGNNAYAGTNVGIGMEGETGRSGSAVAQGSGDAILLNTGQIAVSSNFSYGMQANSEYGTARATNAGDITLNGFSSVGIAVTAGNVVAPDTGLGAIANNSGAISATATNIAIGIRAETYGNTVAGVPFQVTNSGDITATAQVRAQGVNGVIFNADPLTIDNSGSIYADAPINTRQSYYMGSRGDASGIHTNTYTGLATVTNSGSITAVTHEDNQAPGSASGVFMSNGYSNAYHPTYGNVVLDNKGSINASLISNNALPAVGNQQRYDGSTVFGPSNTATGILTASTYGDVSITNAGTINASAQSDHYAAGGTDKGVTTANGISAVSFMGDFQNTYGNTFAAGKIAITNSLYGKIATTAQSGDASGDTAIANGISAVVTVGSYGASLISAGHGVTINNAGTVSATALIANDATGAATASGISAINGSAAGYANVTNTGAIVAMATTTGAATATGIFASGYSVTAALNAGGVINATAIGASGAATGLSMVQTGSAPLTTNNDGVLMATFIGAGQATGATITSGGDIIFSNTNVIQANNATSAVGVAFNSPTTVTLTNSGAITANAAAAGSVALLSTGASNDTFGNSGTITGAIQTGAGDDVLNNAGTWNAVGASDFGAGDDTVTNTGTIHLSNTTISLGSDPAGNQFNNSGTITVLGNNTITMDTGTPVNPNPFNNNGTLNFQNGAANDTLTINGNFAGNGQIDMDVDGAHGTGDLLKINGNVAAGSVSTVNVNLLTDPTTASSMIPLVQVGGTAAAGAFVLGTFTQPKGFLGLSESLVNTSTASTLGLTVAATPAPPAPPAPPPAPPAGGPPGTGVVVTVTGLSQLGTLAASAAPGVQSLMNSQIGTLEDRMGAASQTIKGGLSLWTRAFADSGTVNPDHSAGNFGQNGNFGFDQSNSGEEVGLDFAISDEFKAGALFAKSQANQSLDGDQADSSKVTGNTSGIYGTWIASNGLYVDASYRWMSFNDRLHAPNGYASIHGNADAFNLEAGKTWVLQNGLQIAPQFQYTLTKVDNINSQAGSLAGFQSNGDDASRARLGVMFSKSYTPTSSNAMWTPYASLSVVQELDGKNSYSVNNTFFGETDTKGTSALAETGVNVQIGKLAVFGGLNWQDGGALKSFFGGQVGLRYTW